MVLVLNPVIPKVNTFPTSRLLYPVTKVVNVELVETSSKYFVEPDVACQLAVKPEEVILVAANATGAASALHALMTACSVTQLPRFTEMLLAPAP